MDYRIAVLGDRESVLGFKALGLEVYPATPVEARRVFLDLLEKKDRYAVIYITEELAEGLEAEIDELKDELIPAVIPIPSRSGRTGLGMRALAKAVERAVGANILGSED
jgi:V/A-type H+-transporting ATPase subunit F